MPIRLILALVFIFICGSSSSYAGLPEFSLGGAQEEEFKKPSSVEIEADKMGFASAENKATAQGHVVVKSGKETLYADSLELDRTKQEGTARGHVYLDSPKAQVDADAATYNFNQQTGSFTNARIFNSPFQAKGPQIQKVSANHIVMNQGYMTTCDHDDPHFRLKSRRLDIYQGDKAVARGVTMYLGKMPVMYMPRYTQDLKNKPWFTFVPGMKKDLGYFLLTRSRIFSNDYLTTTIRADFYERQGIGWGMDNKYRTDHYGSGIIRNYYIRERSIAAKHPWLLKTEPSVSNERYKIEWRHKWDMDDKTSAVWQYYRLSDDVLLKKYFERESRQGDTSTYFFLSRALPHGNVSFRLDHRVNRFVSAVDRTPEIRYENSGQEIAETGFFVKSNNTYSNLVKRAASPTEDRRKTMRFDTNNELYYPAKVAFIEVRPFAGGQHTYYTRAIDPARDKTLRGIFRTGMDLSTKFSRVWNVKKDVLGMKIDRLRHVVTPTAAYIYQHRPSVGSSNFNQFDAVDSLEQAHKIGLGLEHKLQTKRDKKTVDLLRALFFSDFALKENPSRGGFGPYNMDVEFKPNDWLTFNMDASYDHYEDHIASANFETYINHGEKWTLGVGRRYARDSEDEVTTEWAYRINSKWKIKMYDRFNVDKGILKVEEYAITRDLHEWEMDLKYSQERGAGASFLMVFRLKAFPDMDLDLIGNSFHQRKAGSQSGE